MHIFGPRPDTTCGAGRHRGLWPKVTGPRGGHDHVNSWKGLGTEKAPAGDHLPTGSRVVLWHLHRAVTEKTLKVSAATSGVQSLEQGTWVGLLLRKHSGAEFADRASRFPHGIRATQTLVAVCVETGFWEMP